MSENPEMSSPITVDFRIVKEKRTTDCFENKKKKTQKAIWLHANIVNCWYYNII